ncbi:Filamentous growth regulator 27 [Candida viswanathii]|uniref:Filamentous growth regulator 27 n=1 Tax=Candida viswanathii TaxID=5486 RepID=A0A367XZC7_9ASCO|nr:Filamentous growth regulator 27 [Candida viswanathii]
MEIDFDKRTKVSQACDYCKQRKYKCTGTSPCELCTRKGVECKFSIVDRRTLRRTNRKRKTKSESKDPEEEAERPIIPTIAKPQKDNDEIDVHDLKRLSKRSKIPLQFQPIIRFPLHKVEVPASEDPGSSPTEGRSPLASQSPGYQPQSNNQPPEKPRYPAEYAEPQKVLYDSQGNLRYVGESSPLSFLFECRNIFNERLGPSTFTSETDTLEVIEDPEEFTQVVQVLLPDRQLFEDILELFCINLLQASYFVDVEYFKTHTLNAIYENFDQCSPGQIAITNMILGNGLLFAEIANHPILKRLSSPNMKSSSYFDYGYYLTKSYMHFGMLWIVEGFLLAYCYYQVKQHRNTAWLMLGMGVRSAQAMGLHRRYINESFTDYNFVVHRRRLYRTLYILDRITSILLGRPLIIDDYDWDDFDSEDIFVRDDNGIIIQDPRFEAMIHECKIVRVGGKVLRNFYLEGIMNPFKAEKLAIELKLWSLNLPEHLQIDKLFVEEVAKPGDFLDNKIPLLIMHICQLYLIVLVGRPFFMYLIFNKKRRKNILNKPKTKQEIAMKNFIAITVKSSLLIVQLVDKYITTLKFKSARIELHGTTHATLMACLVIGLSILYLEHNRYTFQDVYYSAKLMKYLNIGKKIYTFYEQSNPMSTRFRIIVEQMQQALMDKFNLDIEGNKIKSRRVSNRKLQLLPQLKHTAQGVSDLEQSYQMQETDQRVTNLGGTITETQDLPFNEDYLNFFENFQILLSQPVDNAFGVQSEPKVGTSASLMLPEPTTGSSILSTTETLNEFMQNSQMHDMYK